MRISRTAIGAALLVSTATIVGSGAAAQRLQQLSLECRAPIVDRCRSAQGDRRECVMAAMQTMSDACRRQVSDAAGSRAVLPAGMREVSYGSDAKQRIDLLPGTATKRQPLLVFIHGGGWSIGDKRQSIASKAAMASRLGMAFASLNYRLVPQARVEDQAADIASAIAYLRTHAAGNGIDPDHIVLMGHSAGAHLAALVASDPSWLTKAGVPLSSISGVILLDGAAYDVGAQLSDPRNRVQSMYQAAFGSDPARQQSLSPTAHAAAPNVARWLILPIERRADSTSQSQALATALRAARADVTLTPVPRATHMTLNRQLGEPGDFATGEVERFMAEAR